MDVVGELFQIRPTPTTMQNMGSLANPTAHDGVYKVDGHRRPEPHAGEKNFRFLSQATGPESPLPPDFFSPWAGPGWISRLKKKLSDLHKCCMKVARLGKRNVTKVLSIQ